jgi:hypothetical protein
MAMEKRVFLEILEQIVRGFEDPAFRAEYAAAKAQGNVTRLMELAMGVQRRAFASQGLDETNGSVQFKEAGRTFGLDGDVAPQLARMKAALGK